MERCQAATLAATRSLTSLSMRLRPDAYRVANVALEHCWQSAGKRSAFSRSDQAPIACRSRPNLDAPETRFLKQACHLAL